MLNYKCCSDKNSLLICHDDDERVPASMAIRPLPAEVPEWLHEVLQPLVAKVTELSEQVKRCHARVDKVTHQKPAPATQGWRFPLLSAAAAPKASETCLDEVLATQAELRRQVEEGQRATEALLQRTDKLQAVVSAAEAAQLSALEQIKVLKAKTEQLAEGGGGGGLDFGAPIGKTLNTQDYAVMHAETRQELDECKQTLDVISDIVLQGGGRCTSLTPSRPDDAAARLRELARLRSANKE